MWEQLINTMGFPHLEVSLKQSLSLSLQWTILSMLRFWSLSQLGLSMYAQDTHTHARTHTHYSIYQFTYTTNAMPCFCCSLPKDNMPVSVQTIPI